MTTAPTGRRTCQALPIIRLNAENETFIMTCWHCDYRVDVFKQITATEARILIAKHNIREW